MDDQSMPLHQWIAMASSHVAAKDKELLAIFQRDWTEGAVVNPLLFPLQQTPAAWRGHFDWFATIENFVLSPDKAGPVRGFEPIPSTTLAETIMAPADFTGATVIMEKSVGPKDFQPTPGSRPASLEVGTVVMDATDSLGDLEDLGTLIMAEKASKSKPEPAATPQISPPASKTRPIKEPAQEVRLDKIATTIFEAAAPVEPGELDDLETLINLSKKTPQTATTLNLPAQPPGKPAETHAKPPEEGTVILVPEKKVSPAATVPPTLPKRPAGPVKTGPSAPTKPIETPVKAGGKTLDAGTVVLRPEEMDRREGPALPAQPKTKKPEPAKEGPVILARTAISPEKAPVDPSSTIITTAEAGVKAPEPSRPADKPALKPAADKNEDLSLDLDDLEDLSWMDK